MSDELLMAADELMIVTSEPPPRLPGTEHQLEVFEEVFDLCSCGCCSDSLPDRPGFDRWRFAWTRAKHFRRAAELYGSQAEQRCRYLADMPLDDPGQDIASAHDYECAYYEAAERADWGTRS